MVIRLPVWTRLLSFLMLNRFLEINQLLAEDGQPSRPFETIIRVSTFKKKKLASILALIHAEQF